MKQYLEIDPWKIVESGLHKDHAQVTESIFSLGNGMIGQRGNFDESYSGHTLQGNYVAGIYYPDKTRVGWWKNGYPEYFAKVLNAVNWISIEIKAGDEMLDLNTSQISEFERTLDMQLGLLQRNFVWHTQNGKIRLEYERFLHYADKSLSYQKVEIKSIDYKGDIHVVSALDFDVRNQDANYDEQFWSAESAVDTDDYLLLSARTKKTDFHVLAAMSNLLVMDDMQEKNIASERQMLDMYVSDSVRTTLEPSEELRIFKTVAICSDFHHGMDTDLVDLAIAQLDDAETYYSARDSHTAAWSDVWDSADIIIRGDDSAQQGIRFNIFQLYQTYTGDDARLNIGPKGFTGEKYGGSTYWDTEAYCLPFYMMTASQNVARNLLIYRHKHLAKAIKNAEKLGFKDGAALYPMVTMNGEECHNEWEITFEEIHRNGAIAYAIFDYVSYTGDYAYIADFGLDVLVGIARFWAQRVNWSKAKEAYVMLGVTGPNEYENNVNNNWYTNYIAKWCLEYATESVGRYPDQGPDVNEAEWKHWMEIAAHMYLPESEELGVFLQQDGFLDKVIEPCSELADQDRPLNQNWSWDRILRSCYIKQADVLQGMYFFEDDFSTEELRLNFDFYEPITVHESSLSPCVHSILACRLGKMKKAFEMYLRTSRLDLDDYNNDTEDGLHITSMAGTWMSIVKGFAGLTISDDHLALDPKLPKTWKGIAFKVLYRGHIIQLEFDHNKIEIRNQSSDAIDIKVQDSLYSFEPDASRSLDIR